LRRAALVTRRHHQHDEHDELHRTNVLINAAGD
jgi:hypothetical protein